MCKKPRILGIAPYEGLVSLMNQYAKQRQDIRLTAIYGNLEGGAAIAKERYMDYDLIISRANTASMIDRTVPIPVIDIKMDYYDVLRCIKMAEQTKTRFAVLGFHSLTSIAKSLCSLLKMPVDIFSISTFSEASDLLNKLKAEGYETVICDTIPYNRAKLIGITPILLTSSMESLKAAVDSAIYYYHEYRSLHQSASLMQQVLKRSTSRYMVLDGQGSCLFASMEDEKKQQFSEILKEELPHCRQDQERTFFIRAEDQLYSVHSSYISEENGTMFQLIRSQIPLTYSKYGITIMDRWQAEASFENSFYSNTELAREIITRAQEMADSSLPLMITGEVGTGKDRAAHIYYAKSARRSCPMYVINCSYLNDKSWSFITNHYNSPFTDNGNTIYISNIGQLSSTRQKQLLSILLDTNVHVRNRLILSCVQPAEGSLPHAAVEYINALGCILAVVKPLRQEKADIAASAGLYLNALNRDLGKQVVGFDDGALKLLIHYDYPHNRTQFKRILKEAALRTTEPYISEDTIRQILEQEQVLLKKEHQPAQDSASCSGHEMILELNQTLDAMNRDIVVRTRSLCGGNQTVAAKKLGISRTTLWRYLNR